MLLNSMSEQLSEFDMVEAIEVIVLELFAVSLLSSGSSWADNGTFSATTGGSSVFGKLPLFTSSIAFRSCVEGKCQMRVIKKNLSNFIPP